MSNFPDDLKYAKTHEWVKRDGDNFLLGISDYAQSQLGDIVYVDFPDLDDEIDAGDACGELESSKAVSEINMPFNGTVIEINEVLEDEPELINEKPYETWILKIKATNSEDYNNLMSAKEAEEEVRREE